MLHIIKDFILWVSYYTGADPLWVGVLIVACLMKVITSCYCIWQPKYKTITTKDEKSGNVTTITYELKD